MLAQPGPVTLGADAGAVFRAAVAAGARELEGRVVAITGAASGIGAALARAFGERGAALALLAEHAGVGVLVNNAGVTSFGAFERLALDELRRVIDINLWGVVHGCRAFLPALGARPSAHIVNLASEAAPAGMSWQSAYCASKFAVRGLSGASRAELAGKGIGVTCVLPGASATHILASAPSTDPATSDQLSRLLRAHAMSPRRPAHGAVRGVRRNRAEVFAGIDSGLLAWGVRATPALGRGFMRLAAREAMRREGSSAGGTPRVD